MKSVPALGFMGGFELDADPFVIGNGLRFENDIHFASVKSLHNIKLML